MYRKIRPLLFCFEPEWSKMIALKSLNLAYQLKLTALFKQPLNKPVTLMGLTFPNPVGLAAGLDDNADYLDALSMLGFGFIEVGTVTRVAQIGNPKPRLRRLQKEEALINRKGFSNQGVDYLVERLSQVNYRGVLGISIVKNRDTPLEYAVDDYIHCFRKVWRYASYIAINVSSPNTPGLRDLQQSEWLDQLLSQLKIEQADIFARENKYVPLVLKIAPDLSFSALDELAQVLLEKKMDGVIATNTSLEREGVEDSPFAKEAGGLSGRPLNKKSTAVIAHLYHVLKDQIPIIASGGVIDADAAKEKIDAGAKLVQVYTGLIYQGPRLVSDIVERL